LSLLLETTRSPRCWAHSSGRMLHTHSGDSPEKCTTPLSENNLVSCPSRSTKLILIDPPSQSGVESSSSGRFTASASMKALLTDLTEPKVKRSQKLVSCNSSGVKSRKRTTECDTNGMLPLESKTMMRSGIDWRIISLRRSSSFSPLRSSMNIFLRFRDRWAERRLAARLASFLSFHSDMTEFREGTFSARSRSLAAAASEAAAASDCLLA